MLEKTLVLTESNGGVWSREIQVRSLEVLV